MQEVIEPEHYVNTPETWNYTVLHKIILFINKGLGSRDYKCKVILGWRFMFQELVSEKLRTQQMNNDLEKLTHELEKIGLNKERLLQAEQSSDDDR